MLQAVRISASVCPPDTAGAADRRPAGGRRATPRSAARTEWQPAVKIPNTAPQRVVYHLHFAANARHMC